MCIRPCREGCYGRLTPSSTTLEERKIFREASPMGRSGPLFSPVLPGIWMVTSVPVGSLGSISRKKELKEGLTCRGGLRVTKEFKKKAITIPTTLISSSKSQYNFKVKHFHQCVTLFLLKKVLALIFCLWNDQWSDWDLLHRQGWGMAVCQ